MKLRSFLFGMLLGQALMVPWLLKYMKTPRIEALPVPTDAFNKQYSMRKFVIKDVPWDKLILLKQDNNTPSYNLIRTKGNLVIYIEPESEVRKEFAKRYEPNDDVVGFYDRKTHVIYCIDSVDVLIHEIRHVFEGHFHQ
jgi:hypothetical protein